MYENLVIKDRIARKKHTCDLCGKIIDKGEKYEYGCGQGIYQYGPLQPQQSLDGFLLQSEQLFHLLFDVFRASRFHGTI